MLAQAWQEPLISTLAQQIQQDTAVLDLLFACVLVHKLEVLGRLLKCCLAQESMYMYI